MSSVHTHTHTHTHTPTHTNTRTPASLTHELHTHYLDTYGIDESKTTQRAIAVTQYTSMFRTSSTVNENPLQSINQKKFTLNLETARILLTSPISLSLQGNQSESPPHRLDSGIAESTKPQRATAVIQYTSCFALVRLLVNPNTTKMPRLSPSKFVINQMYQVQSP
jgi:hypothetical protein